MELAINVLFLVGMIAAIICLAITCMKSSKKQLEAQLLVSIIWALTFVIGTIFEAVSIAGIFASASFWIHAVTALLASFIAISDLCLVFRKED